MEVGTVLHMFLGDPRINCNACGMADVRRQVFVHGRIIMSEVDGNDLMRRRDGIMEIRLKILPSEAEAWVRWDWILLVIIPVV